MISGSVAQCLREYTNLKNAVLLIFFVSNMNLHQTKGNKYLLKTVELQKKSLSLKTIEKIYLPAVLEFILLT